MNKHKLFSNISMFIGIIVAVSAAFVLFLFVTVAVTVAVSDWDKYGIKTTLWGCEDKIYYVEGGWGDFTDYGEYYFNEKSIRKFEKNKKYHQVTADDIDDIYGYFENFEGIAKRCDFADKYSFDKKSQINIGDYFYIYALEGKSLGSQSHYDKYINSNLS